MGLSSLRRSDVVLKPNASRVLIRSYAIHNRERQLRIISRILTIPPSEAKRSAAKAFEKFEERHKNLREFLLQNYHTVEALVPTDRELPDEYRLLIGAAFAQEYAVESSALFNPSIVPHPDQGAVPPGSLRFVLSLRATGEGHVSSLEFREGIIHEDGKIEIPPTSKFVTEGAIADNPIFGKEVLRDKLLDLGEWNDFSKQILAELPQRFSLKEIEAVLDSTERMNRQASLVWGPTINRMRTLLRSHYTVSFDESRPISERVIYPKAPTERGGIEDARFVRFVEEDGKAVYYGVYTAFDGTMILPQLISSKDFLSFEVSTLNGPQIENKGLALFPRKVNGRYAMVGRQDNENLYLMYSDHLLFWHSRELLLRPTYMWETVQIGNCGSPIETKWGWLLLTHGVGPMRTYSIGAVLLDLESPSKVIGRLPTPLLEPTRRERDGYVPNVVYSCGALIHRDRLILPYAMSDYSTGFATVDLEELIHELKRRGGKEYG
jgi:predicted GH43/DUF377 family glycosyl hydrolase